MTATFNALPSYALSVIKSGTGGGTVTCDGGTCSATYLSGKNVVLAAAPAAGSTFAGWSGSSCSGTGTCTVAMTAARSVTATFNALPADDHGNTIGTATAVSANSLTAGNIEISGDVDYFKVDVPSQGELKASTIGSTDTYGYLIDSSGRELAANDDVSASDKNFGIVRIVAKGTYYIKVRHQSSSGTGAYYLAVAFSAINSAPTNAVILLHGLNSKPDTWEPIVAKRWSGQCAEIYGGRISYTANTLSGKEACYRVRFGSFDVNSMLAGIEGIKCQDAALGCRGDYTKIYNNSISNDLGTEVAQAISAVRSRLGENVKIVLVGHSRGGLAARSALQSRSPVDYTSVIGLVTTGTPHEGSPFGKIYKYLADNCPRGNLATSQLKGDCKDDWQAADYLLTDQDLDLRKPAIDFLSSTSSDISDLRNTVKNLTQRSIQIKKIAYTGVVLGLLGEKIILGSTFHYYAWGSTSGKPQFSNRSRNWALCDSLTSCVKTESDEEFSGDGIVPVTSQASVTIGGTTDRYRPTTIYHTTETGVGQVPDIEAAINSIK